MALKRKRSSQTFSSPSITTTLNDTTPSSIPFFYQHSKPLEPLQEKPSWSWPTYDDSPQSSHHLNSRTRKRHRDDRPDEEAVYAATMEKLFDAQRKHLDLLPIQSCIADEQPMVEDEPIILPAQKSTLHSFWRIQSTPTQVQQIQSHVDQSTDPNQDVSGGTCECELRQDDAMELDTGLYEPEIVCVVCSKQVCDTCAVMRDRRLCGRCASSR